MSLKNMIEEISIPSYSHKQEMFNAISHALGILVALFLIVFLIVLYSTAQISLFYFIGFLIFGISAFMVYLISAIYHYLDPTSFKKKLFSHHLSDCRLCGLSLEFCSVLSYLHRRL